jgi:hypothetical protein
MPNSLRYIIDDTGQKTSVLVPLKVWENLNINYQKLQNKLEVLNGITAGLNEVQQIKKTGGKLQSLKDFLK